MRRPDALGARLREVSLGTDAVEAAAVVAVAADADPPAGADREGGVAVEPASCLRDVKLASLAGAVVMLRDVACLTFRDEAELTGRENGADVSVPAGMMTRSGQVAAQLLV